MAKCGCLWIVLFYLSYLLLGAVIVSLIERPYERSLRNQLRSLKSGLLNDTPCLAESDLDDFLERALEAHRYGVSVLTNSSQTNWDFASAFFFVSTLVTTVGYGHTTPISDGGKGFSIFFAALGLPFTMLLLAVLVQRLMIYLTDRPIQAVQERLGYSKRRVTQVHCLVMFLFTVIGFFLIPAAIFSAIEKDWTYLNAFYFCFISLSTIGLGDYVPGDLDNQILQPLYKISVTFYLLCGLTVMLLLIQTSQKAMGLHFLTQIFDLPLAEDDEEGDEELVLHSTGTHPSLQLNGLKADTRPLAHSEPPSYNSILPSSDQRESQRLEPLPNSGGMPKCG
ncbi:potassium channel subfamily K member 1-like [Hemiscyllium ocellatum]|uniref:potassium channel subfamily K member 1-like n=1 Tax=Hemiscyllium ocellatum TaxID=170820 RepID=UPI00296630B7|nr:potassium channel subfamily K member 1-like [Hemiscyllium ocellatum]